MDDRIKVKRWPGRVTRVEVRTDDLDDIGEETFTRSLAEAGLESHMRVGLPRVSKSSPYVVTILFDEGRTDQGAPGTEVTL
ncbi:hypothetical protein [Mycetocola saprophilus]|uniref:hypothetical protein n=1 Tax=Mycetocola saprophilus TaxID=76636 RepID=UPI0004C164F2|nr:hypothetical protein [Mycetocola saprophilus]